MHLIKNLVFKMMIKKFKLKTNQFSDSKYW